MRIHHALELLGAGCSVNEISERLGYARPSSFIDVFKRVMGSTPGTFMGSTTQAPKG
ncbi:MAG: helix-turn-helix domain-containing protein [Brevibacterium sp.]